MICKDCKIELNNVHCNRKRCEKCALTKSKQLTAESIKRWKLKNSDKVKKDNKIWANKFPLKKRFTHAKGIAKDHDREFVFSENEMITFWNTPCEYCNKVILNEKGIGLDRLDNSLGYVKTNVVPCCGDCNYIKGTRLTHDEMKVAMKAVLEFRGLKA